MGEGKYSVFLGNIGSCCDRYCAAYGRKFSVEELFDRAKRIPLLTAVDLVMDQEFIQNKDKIKENLSRTGLKVASVAVDTFANPLYQKGSFSSVDKDIRAQAIEDAKSAMDFADEVGCKIMTTWPGQDGFDYIFQADYIKERQLFSDAIAELCGYRKDITVTMEYKIKEPRTR
jgi:Predicted sugar isomerase